MIAPRSRRGTRRLWVAAGITLALLLAGLWAAQEPDIMRLFVRQDWTWADMQRRGVWRVGMDPSFPPFETLDDAGNPIGFDVDLAQRMAQEWGLELEIAAMGYDSLLDALQAGRIDSVVSALPYDPRVTRDFGFSPPYFEAGLMLAVRAGSPITGVASLDNRAIAVEWGSLGDMVGRQLQRERTGLELVPFSAPDEAVQAMLADTENGPEIDALLVDAVTLRQAQGQGAALVAVGPPLESTPYVIAAPWQATTLQEQIAETLARFAETGVMAELETKWFGPLPDSP